MSPQLVKLGFTLWVGGMIVLVGSLLVRGTAGWVMFGVGAGISIIGTLIEAIAKRRENRVSYRSLFDTDDDWPREPKD